jgi:hypothetical protein
MGQHTNLSSMMRVVRDHIRQHRRTRGPRPRPTVPPKSFDLALRPQQGHRKHLGATRSTHNQRGLGLSLRALLWSSVAGSFRSGADSLIHFRRIL